jgi:hypothetical protein
VLSRRGALSGLWAAGLALGAVLAVARAGGGKGLFNDYYDYWAAGRALNQGLDPYDPNQIGEVLASAGVHSTVGGYGYSYPLILAELMRPLALLSPSLSATLFLAVSIVCLAIGIALLTSPLEGLSLWRLLVLATACAFFSPIDGTLYFGQVNLLLLPLLVLASWGRVRGLAIAGSTAVKLYPAATAGAFVLGGRREVKSLVWCLALVVFLGLLPNLLWGHSSYSHSLLRMLSPDTFWSDQSVNGFLSRLGQRSQWTAPPLPGLPVTLLMLIVCGGLGFGVLGLLARPGGASWQACFGLLLWFGAVAAPKNSLWNFAPLVIVLVYCSTRMRGRPFVAALLVLAYALLEAQQLANAARDSLYQGHAALTWLSSLGFYGALLLGAAMALVVSTERSGEPTPDARAPATPERVPEQSLTH